jgi:hypothetical protein
MADVEIVVEPRNDIVFAARGGSEALTLFNLRILRLPHRGGGADQVALSASRLSAAMASSRRAAQATFPSCNSCNLRCEKGSKIRHKIRHAAIGKQILQEND